MSQSPRDTSDARACPVCGVGTPDDFVARRNVPVHQNLLCRSLDEATALACGQLTMSICPHCGFATNRTFDASLLRYGEQYDNTQMHSAAFEEYVGERISHLVDGCGVQNASIIEVGCGKGHFLQKLVASHPANRGHGFDPSYLGAASMFDGRLQFHRQFYDASCAELGADVVICRHVIEHIDQPLRMLRDVRQALRHAPHARVFFETPCLNWILKHQVAWDFFYEHCSLFTAESLATAFRRAGFDLRSVDHVFGGQYPWMEVSPRAVETSLGEHPAQGDSTDASQRSAAAEVRSLISLARSYGATEQARNLAWRTECQSLSQAGGVAIWGAGAKGVTLANLVDPDRKWIRCLIDVNPHKQGQYLPGTGHLIVPPTAIPAMRVSHVILLNPNYRAEVAQTLAELKLFHVSLVDLMQEKAVAAPKLIIDTESQQLTRVNGKGQDVVPLYSPEAFDLISQQWVRVGWNQKYSYTFSWLGIPIIQLPEDLVRMQEVLFQVRPDVIIETGVAHGGSLIFYATLCKVLGRGRVVGIDIEIRPHNRAAIEGHPLASCITLIEGNSVSAETVGRAQASIRPGEKVLVILDSCHTKEHVLAELEAYAPLVSEDSYIVATDGIMQDLHDVPRGQPEWKNDHPSAAASEFASRHPEFVLGQPDWPFNESELSRNVTHWPGAWLRRRKVQAA